MLKESKPLSKSHTPSFINILKPRYGRRSNSYDYQKFSLESRYESRAHSCSNSRSKYHNHSSHNHSPFYDRNRYPLIKFIDNLLEEQIFFLARTIIQQCLVVHINLTLVLANAPLVITTPLLDAIIHHIVHLLNHVIIPPTSISL